MEKYIGNDYLLHQHILNLESFLKHLETGRLTPKMWDYYYAELIALHKFVDIIPIRVKKKIIDRYTSIELWVSLNMIVPGMDKR